MPYDREWEESEDFEVLEDALYAGVQQQDYTEEQLHRALANLGPYESWEGVQFTINNDAHVVMSIFDANERLSQFTVSHVTDREWNAVYHWVDNRGVDYDIIVDSDPKMVA